jgi:chemotaxis response regulator CheB
MAAHRTRVLVLYSHAILGEGLVQFLADDEHLEVHALSQEAIDAVDSAFGAPPDVIVLEEDGPVSAADLMGRTDCPVIIDVSISSPNAWTIRRRAVHAKPERLAEAIRQACHEEAAASHRPARGQRGMCTSRLASPAASEVEGVPGGGSSAGPARSTRILA